MSKINIVPNASGAGTFTIASPDSATDRTFTLPDSDGTPVMADSGNVAITGTVSVAGAATFESTVSAAGAVTLGSTVSAAGAVTLGSTVSVAGAVTLGSTVSAAGAVTLGSTVSVAGAVTTGSTITMADTELVRPILKDYGEKVNALGSGSGTRDIDLTLGNVVSNTVTGTTTFTFSNPTASGNNCSFVLYLTNGGSSTVNWPGSVNWPGGSSPTLTSSGVDLLVFQTIDGGTIWYGNLVGDDYS